MMALLFRLAVGLLVAAYLAVVYMVASFLAWAGYHE